MLKWGPIKNLNAHCVATKKMKTTPQRMTHNLPTSVLHLLFFVSPFYLFREREREREREGFYKDFTFFQISCIIKHRRLEFLFGRGGFLNFDILLKTKAIPKLTHAIYFVLQQSLKSILKPVFQ